MKVTIIDDTPQRLFKLEVFLKAKTIIVDQSSEVNDNLVNNGSTLFLIHKSNDSIASFVQKLEPKKYILFFSGGGIANKIEGVNYTDRKFNLPDVFNVGNEGQALNRIGQIVDVLKKANNATNALSEINKILGFDPEEETLTEDIYTAIYENKSEEIIEKAVSKRDNYLSDKVKQAK